MATGNSTSRNIAIAGSGIAGLAAGWLLQQHGHRVTVFEKLDHLGMSAHGITLPDRPLDPEAPLRFDVPPRLFNPELWPHLVQLYQEVGVETVAIDPSKCFLDAQGDAYLTMSSGYWPALKGLLNKPGRLVATQSRRLLQLARHYQKDGRWPEMSMQEFWLTNDFSPEYTHRFLYPALSSTVCTCDFEALDHYPVDILLPALLAMVQGSPLKRTRWGSPDVVQRLSEPLNVELGVPIRNAYRLPQSDSPAWQSDGSDQNDGVIVETDRQRHVFDHLIVGTQANHVARMVSDLSQQEQEILNGFQYVPAPVIVHRDINWMPRDRRHWSHFNIRTRTSDPSSGSGQSMCTIWMNRFCNDKPLPRDYFQTIMPYDVPEPTEQIATVSLQRPVVTLASSRLWQQIQQLHQEPDRRIWFCGSYAQPGIPLLESGVASARNIFQQIQRSFLPIP